MPKINIKKKALLIKKACSDTFLKLFFFIQNQKFSNKNRIIFFFFFFFDVFRPPIFEKLFIFVFLINVFLRGLLKSRKIVYSAISDVTEWHKSSIVNFYFLTSVFMDTFQKHSPRVFCKGDVLDIFQNQQENTFVY